MKNAVVFVLLCLSLSACGQKGPLYLPQPAKPQPETPAPQSAPEQPEAESAASAQASSAAKLD